VGTALVAGATSAATLDETLGRSAQEGPELLERFERSSRAAGNDET
jgi:hypothetical protein